MQAGRLALNSKTVLLVLFGITVLFLMCKHWPSAPSSTTFPDYSRVQVQGNKKIIKVQKKQIPVVAECKQVQHSPQLCALGFFFACVILLSLHMAIALSLSLSVPIKGVIVSSSATEPSLPCINDSRVLYEVQLRYPPFTLKLPKFVDEKVRSLSCITKFQFLVESVVFLQGGDVCKREQGRL